MSDLFLETTKSFCSSSFKSIPSKIAGLCVLRIFVYHIFLQITNNHHKFCVQSFGFSEASILSIAKVFGVSFDTIKVI